MRRREFIAGLGAAASPVVARAQQATLPVVGYLISSTFEAMRTSIDAFNRGLGEVGYAHGRNVALEYRMAEDRLDRLSLLAEELVHRRVTVIATTSNSPTALAAKTATRSIPIVFLVGADPVAMGLVASLARPGGNVTGITSLANELVPKRLALLHELVPSTTTVGLLVNPNNPANAQSALGEPIEAARRLGIRLLVLNVSSPSDIEHAFEALSAQHADGLLTAPESLFIAQGNQIVALADRYRLPVIQGRDFVRAGGLIGYEGDLLEAHRLAGGYVGRILNGDKPGDLPVQQAAKFVLSINLKTAKTLGLTVPNTLLVSADEVIE
jgi:putative tryptophan/tyrosine transport system substrate-binding protein